MVSNVVMISSENNIFLFLGPQFMVINLIYYQVKILSYSTIETHIKFISGKKIKIYGF
jgi:hypothetical protein